MRKRVQVLQFASQHCPCCCSASCAVLNPLSSMPASFCAVWDRSANSHVKLASFISTSYIWHVQSGLKPVPQQNHLLAELSALQSALSAWRKQSQLMKRLLLPMMLHQWSSFLPALLQLHHQPALQAATPQTAKQQVTCKRLSLGPICMLCY